MPRESEPLVRIHIRVFASDYEWLKENIGLNIGHNKAIRYIVRRYIKAVKTRAEHAARSVAGELEADKAEMEKEE